MPTTRTSRSRRWRPLVAVGAAALALGVTAPAFAADHTFPTNGTFDPDVRDGGWASTAATNGDLVNLLAEAGTGYVDSPANPTGAIQSSFNTILNVLGLVAKGHTSWTSPAFSAPGGATEATLTYDSNATLPGILSPTGAVELIGHITGDVVLKDLSFRTETKLDTLHYGATYPWATRTVPVAPDMLVAGHVYQLEFRHTFTSLATVLAGSTVQLDNIKLKVTTK